MKLEEQFVDGENKIIIDCPCCGNQEAVYLIRANRFIDGLQASQCDSCKTIYVINIETKFTCRAEVYKCDSTIPEGGSDDK